MKLISRFRFGLRTFLLVVLVVGTTLGWIAHHQSEYDREQAILAEYRSETKLAFPVEMSADPNSRFLILF